MACEELVGVITDYLEGVLADDDRRRFEEHLAGCPHCTEYLAEMRTTLRLLGRLDPERLPEHVRHDLVRAFRDWNAR
jgi:anti-sigma factor RsiW